MYYFTSYLIRAGANYIPNRCVVELEDFNVVDGESLVAIENAIKRMNKWEDKQYTIILNNLVPLPHIKKTQINEDHIVKLEQNSDFGAM